MTNITCMALWEAFSKTCMTSALCGKMMKITLILLDEFSRFLFTLSSDNHH